MIDTLNAKDAAASLQSRRDKLRFTIEARNNIHRCILVRGPLGLWAQIITAPGLLTVHGNHGTYSWARNSDDPFTWFEVSDYAFTKLVATDCSGGRDERYDWYFDVFKTALEASVRDRAGDDIDAYSGDPLADVVLEERIYELEPKEGQGGAVVDFEAEDVSVLLNAGKDESFHAYFSAFLACEVRDWFLKTEATK